LKPVAIFRYARTEGPGHFATFLSMHGVEWTLVALDEGEPVPADPGAFSGLGFMGGPMSANDELPWTQPVLQLMRDAIAARVPVIGHCLGGQLLAQALGARVRRTAVPEIGWIGVESTDVDAQNAWFGGRSRFTPFQWHYDVFDVPAGAKRVLTNHFNVNQGYVIDDRHIGFQCHIEMTRELVETWCASGADEIAGPGTPPRQSGDEIMRDLAGRLAALQAVADGVYARWAEGLAR
jgi:GMP synthase-like glutamine amidotransferase